MADRPTALITGASAGLGAEFARQLAAAGHDLVLVARRREMLEELAAVVEQQHGARSEIICADLARPEAPQRILEQLARLDLTIDFLVNNAGIAGCDLLQERDWGKQQAFFQLMMTSVAHLCHLLIPPMVQRGHGRVINVASVAGRVPRAGGCNYGPAKAYVIALSEDLWLTLRGTGVNVCALCPGYTHTEFHAVGGLQETKDRLPRWIWYGAPTVVRDGIRAVDRGRPICISGRLYRWLDPLLQSVFTRHLLRVSAGH